MFAKKSSLMVLSVLACSLPISSAFAAEEDKKAPKVGGLSGSFTFGLNTSEGNTNTGRANASFLAKYGVKDTGSFSHTLLGGYDYADRGVARGSDRIETKNDKELSYKLDYGLTKRSNVFAYLGYEDNGKAKLDSQEMIGVGYEISGLGTQNHHFSLGLGVGDLSVEYTDGTEGFSGTALRASIGYKGKLTQQLSLSTGVVVLAADERTMTRAVTKVDYAMSNRWSLVLKHKYTEYDTIPDTALDKRDDNLTFNVAFKF